MESSAGPALLRFEGAMVFENAAEVWRSATAAARPLGGGDHVRFELSAVDSLDGGTAALLAALRAELESRGAQVEVVGAKERVADLLKLFVTQAAPSRARKRPQRLLEQIGRATVGLAREVRAALAFTGEFVVALREVIRAPRTANLRDALPIAERAGVDAVPIVLTINFLLGFVMAYQSAEQLKLFGANIYVADLVGIAITREIGPLMTAIVVCGRSGAAFAAELGTMKVSEEIDALRTLGFAPIPYLVVPRIVALVAVVPVLTLMADVVAGAGGILVGVTSLDLTPTAYFHETQRAVVPWDVISGLVKSCAFAVVIALVACQQGLSTTGGAEGVGRRTTSSVVVTLFLLVAVDSLLTMLLRRSHLR